MKHQTNISELKRTFLETSTETALTNEWEKRLSTSPVRLAVRQEDAPMIEPLVPEEVSVCSVGMSLPRTGSGTGKWGHGQAWDEVVHCSQDPMEQVDGGRGLSIRWR